MRLFKGGRNKEDIYDKCKKNGYIDIDGEYHGWHDQIGFFPEYHYESEGEELRWKAKEIVNQITTDPIEQYIAELMLENYTEKEIAVMLNISPARVKWFMRKIDGWKRKEGKK